MVVAGCTQKGEPVRICRFEQLLFEGKGDAADFASPLLNYHPEDAEFMHAVADFTSDPMVRQLYTVTDSLYGDLSWLEEELGNAMSRAHECLPAMNYRFFFTLVTADLEDYANRVFCNNTDLAISIDHYAIGHVEGLQRYGVPNYIARLCRREYILPDCMAAAARNHIELPEGDLTFLDYAIAEGKTLYFLDQVLPHVHDTLKIRYTGKQLAWMEENEENVWGWLIQNGVLFSNDNTQLRNLLDEAPKTNAFGDGSAPRTGDYIGWQIVKQYMKKTDASMGELFAENNSRKILETSGWRP